MMSWIKLPDHFSSGMILQQQVVTRISGWTDPRTNLSIDLHRTPFNRQLVLPHDPNYGLVFHCDLESDESGCFSCELPPFKASYDPFQLIISHDVHREQFDQLLFGEVFLLVGDGLLSQAYDPEATARQTPSLRQLPHVRILNTDQTDKQHSWMSADQLTGDRDCSAAGLAFARELHLDLHLPVGLIQSTKAQSRLSDWSKDLEAGLFSARLAPLTGMGLRGIVWSGGPRDLTEPAARRSELTTLARNVRSLFRSPDPLPPALLLVLHQTDYLGQSTFYQQSVVNEALIYAAHQLDEPTALIPSAGLTAGQFCQQLGSRLRLISLGLLYQRKAPRSAPECASIELVGGKMMLSFSNAGEGLRLIGDESRVRGFAVCGADRVYREANARILYGVRVMVWHDDIPNPIGITYGFYDLNERANLISKDQLPVVPFRSDQIVSIYHLPQEWMHCDETSLWQIISGEAVLKREQANKSEGESSLLLSYQTDREQHVTIAPLIDRAIDFPPLDLSRAGRLLIDVFNPDRQTKTIQLSLMAIDPPGAREAMSPAKQLLPALRWQTVAFDLELLGQQLDCSQIIKLSFVVTDQAGRGLLYFDHVRTEFN